MVDEYLLEKQTVSTRSAHLNAEREGMHIVLYTPSQELESTRHTATLFRARIDGLTERDWQGARTGQGSTRHRKRQ